MFQRHCRVPSSARTARRAWLPLLAAASLLAACATVPITGRSQFNVVPLSTEMSLGASAYTETLAEAKVIETGPDAAMVQRVGERIAKAARLFDSKKADSFQWEFKLIDDPETANAWALPGGKSAVYSGLLPITQDEDSLAIVLGHEVGHALASHGAERMSQGIAIDVLLGLANKPMSEMTAAQRDMVMQGLGIGVLLPFSRAHENEADEIGLYLAAAAGYDPRVSIGLWERMGASGSEPPELLSTHPNSATRIEHLKSLMPKALEYYSKAGGKL